MCGSSSHHVQSKSGGKPRTAISGGYAKALIGARYALRVVTLTTTRTRFKRVFHLNFSLPQVEEVLAETKAPRLDPRVWDPQRTPIQLPVLLARDRLPVNSCTKQERPSKVCHAPTTPTSSRAPQETRRERRRGREEAVGIRTGITAGTLKCPAQLELRKK